MLSILQNENGQLYKFIDEDVSTILTGSSFSSVNPESAIEYDIASTAITLTNGIQIDSSHFSNNNDSMSFKNTKSNYLSVSNGISDIIVVVVRSMGSNENFAGSITWRETI